MVATIAFCAVGAALLLSQADTKWLGSLAGMFVGGWGSTPPRPVLPLANLVPMPQALGTPGPDSVAIDADGRGQFETTMLVSGRALPVLVDTGATFVALTYEDAASIGIHPVEGDFRYAVRTANGVGRVAQTVLPSIRVGNVEARNVPALIAAPGALTAQNLLGMSFLNKLSGFQIQSGRLVLRQ